MFVDVFQRHGPELGHFNQPTLRFSGLNELKWIYPDFIAILNGLYSTGFSWGIWFLEKSLTITHSHWNPWSIKPLPMVGWPSTKINTEMGPRIREDAITVVFFSFFFPWYSSYLSDINLWCLSIIFSKPHIFLLSGNQWLENPPSLIKSPL